MNPLAGGILAENNALFPGDSVIQSGLKHLALKFVFDNSDIHCVLSGMRSIQEAEENIGIMESTGIETGEIDKVLSILENKEKGRWIYCTECKYCLPCPQGINIPEIIRINNKYRLFKADKLFSREYNLLEINAGSCIECGICEGRCPNGFPIMNVMKKTVNKYLE
jgi:predicted aldo/keto reductase-like oxidoreductase